MTISIRHALEREYPNNVWDTDELQEQFNILAFSAPYVDVVRKSDGVQGTLQFNHRPRYYFNFKSLNKVK